MITLLNKFDDHYVIEEVDILEIVKHYIHENNLEMYLNDATFDNSIPDIAKYNPITSIIYINMEKLMEVCNMWSNKLQKTYHIDDNNYSYLLNYYLLYSLFHEIVHAMQRKKHDLSFNDPNNLYTFLYELNDELIAKNYNLYNNFHDLFPMEIEANNMGLLYSYNLMSHTKLPNREKRIMHLQYINSLLSNYDKINKFHISTPFNKLCLQDSKINTSLFNDLLNKSKLNKIERLNLGIDITPHEYNSLQRERIRLLIKR